MTSEISDLDLAKLMSGGAGGGTFAVVVPGLLADERYLGKGVLMDTLGVLKADCCCYGCCFCRCNPSCSLCCWLFVLTEKFLLAETWVLAAAPSGLILCTASVILEDVPAVLIGGRSGKDIPGLGIYPLEPDLNTGKAESPVVCLPGSLLEFRGVLGEFC